MFDRSRLAQTFLAKLPEALRGVDFPARRDDLVEMAQINGAEPVLIDGMKDLPDQEYDNIAAVLAEIEANRPPES